MNARKACQGARSKLCPGRRVGRRAEIHLRHFVAGNCTRIFHREAHVGAAVFRRLNLQSGIGEMRVRETIPKCIERLDALLIEPAIPNIDSLGICRSVLNSLVAALRMSRIGSRHVRREVRPGERQPPRWVGATEQDICRGPSAFIAGPPHLQHGLHLVEPWHGNRLAQIEHNNRVRVHCRDVCNQLVLVAGQSEGRPQAAPRKDDCNLGLARSFDRDLVVLLLLRGGNPVESHLLSIV